MFHQYGEQTPLDQFPQKNWQGLPVHDVIILSNFGINIFRGFISTEGQIFHFPTILRSSLQHRYNIGNKTAAEVAAAAATAAAVLFPFLSSVDSARIFLCISVHKID